MLFGNGWASAAPKPSVAQVNESTEAGADPIDSFVTGVAPVNPSDGVTAPSPQHGWYRLCTHARGTRICQSVGRLKLRKTSFSVLIWPASSQPSLPWRIEHDLHLKVEADSLGWCRFIERDALYSHLVCIVEAYAGDARVAAVNTIPNRHSVAPPSLGTPDSQSPKEGHIRSLSGTVVVRDRNPHLGKVMPSAPCVQETAVQANQQANQWRKQGLCGSQNIAGHNAYRAAGQHPTCD